MIISHFQMHIKKQHLSYNYFSFIHEAVNVVMRFFNREIEDCASRQTIILKETNSGRTLRVQN